MSQSVLLKRTGITFDAEEGRWVTTKEGNKLHLDKNGNPDKGNPNVVKAAKGEGKGSSGKSEGSSGSKKTVSVKSGSVASPSDIGFSKQEMERAASKYDPYSQYSEHEGAKEKYLERFKGMRVKSGNSDYEIDHVDTVGGHFSYNGRIGKTKVGDVIKDKNGREYKVVAFHVYPNGNVEAHSNAVEKSLFGPNHHVFDPTKG